MTAEQRDTAPCRDSGGSVSARTGPNTAGQPGSSLAAGDLRAEGPAEARTLHRMREGPGILCTGHEEMSASANPLELVQTQEKSISDGREEVRRRRRL